MTVPMSAIPKSGEVGRSAGSRGEVGAKGGEAFDEAFAKVGREQGGQQGRGRATEAGEAAQRPAEGERQPANMRQPAGRAPAGEQQPNLLPAVVGEGAAAAEGEMQMPPAPIDAKQGQPREAVGTAGKVGEVHAEERAPLEIPRRSEGRFDLAELLGGKKQARGEPVRQIAPDRGSAGEAFVETDPDAATVEAGDLVPTDRVAAPPTEGALPAERAAVAAAATAVAGGQAPTVPARDWASALSALSVGFTSRGIKDAEGTAPRAAAAVTEHPAEAMPEGEGDELFRFAQADAKAENVPGLSSAERLRAALASMVREPGAEARQPAAGTEANAPEFSIVESRKFLGVATGQTAVASVVSAVTENAEWNAMLREASATAATTLNTARNAANTLKIQLSPVELGTVTATLKMSGGHLSVELKVETIEAYRQLSSGENNLVRALRGHGYEIDQVILHQPASGDRGQAASAAPAASSAQGSGGQFAGSNGGGSGEAGNGQQRGGDAGRGGQQHHQGERRGENGGMAGERNRPGGGVYL